jgi:hypothetical protein
MANRLLKPEFQILPIASYQEFFNAHYCGDANNAAAPWFYRCTSAGVRSITGTHFRNISPEGLFLRVAGKNKVYGLNGKLTPEGNISDPNNPPYDGSSIGSFSADQNKQHTHGMQVRTGEAGMNSYTNFFHQLPISGTFSWIYSIQMMNSGDNEAKPASLSVNLYMRY